MSQVLSCVSLVKAFGSTLAVDDVSIAVQEGEIVALLGENGAGKSTLVKMLSGVFEPDSGQVFVGDKPVKFGSAREASSLGIHLVHQELALLPERTVTENIFLGQEIRGRFGLLDWRRMRASAASALAALGAEISADSRVRDLSTASRQMVEIARAAVGESRVVILDEPTAALSPAEARRLFSVVRDMRSRGVGFIYISHRLDEVQELADTIVILKDGRFVASHRNGDLTQAQIVSQMVGRDLNEIFPEAPVVKHVTEGPVLEVMDLVEPPLLKHATFEIRAGEIVGIYGLEGHGQDEILACLAGAMRPQAGRLRLDGKDFGWGDVVTRVAAGFGFVPEDRKSEGLVLDLSSVKNISLPLVRRSISKLGVIAGRREVDVARSAAARAGVRGDIARPVRTLSGGNQQKVVLARWLAAGSRVLLLNQPTRGVDIGAKSEIYRTIRETCSERGDTAIVVSREIAELLGLCDRILVMSYGRMVGEHLRGASEEDVLATAVGGRR